MPNNMGTLPENNCIHNQNRNVHVQFYNRFVKKNKIQ